MTRPIDELVGPWRAEVETSRRRGLMSHSITMEGVVQEVEDWWTRRENELLNQTEAAYEVARSPSTVRRWEQERGLMNYGEPNAPKYQRRDLWRAARAGIVGIPHDRAPSLPDDTSGKIRSIAARRSS